MRASPLLRFSLPFVFIATSVARVPLALAQKSSAPKRSGELLHLTVRPHVGDTLWMQLEQTIDTRSVQHSSTASRSPVAGAPPSRSNPPTERPPDYGPVRDLAVTQSINIRMFAHSLVESSDLRLTTLNAITDSLNVRTGTVGKLGSSRPMALSPEHPSVRIHVTADGAMSVIDPRPGTMALDASLSGMPPMLPSSPVAVGEEWERDIPLPSFPMSGIRADGVVHAEFRLDSLSRNGRLAYVSMTGTLRREGAARDLPPGTQVATSGLLHGFLVLDRVRGWITEAETIIQVQSDVTPRPGDSSPAHALDIRLSQRMKVR